MYRFFVSKEQIDTDNKTVIIKGEDVNHIRNVLRMKEGEEVSSREIKKIIQDTIQEEDKSDPLTDDDLRNILKNKGYNIARRTVAKYREQMGFMPSRMRK